MNTISTHDAVQVHQQCFKALAALEDTFHVIGGKWKLKIIVTLQSHGTMRFNELQRSIEGITSRVLSNELKDLEMNGLVSRNVYSGVPVIIEYKITEYTETLDPM